MSVDLTTKVQLGLEEIATGPRADGATDRPTTRLEPGRHLDCCGMRHASFYLTEIEKTLKLIAREWDSKVPSSDAWHKKLLNQMAAATDTRPAVIASGLVETLSEFLAFRRLFRGASIMLMLWDKLYPLVAKVNQTYIQTREELPIFQTFLDSRNKSSR